VKVGVCGRVVVVLMSGARVRTNTGMGSRVAFNGVSEISGFGRMRFDCRHAFCMRFGLTLYILAY
jgi:hypothetical protein